MADMVAKDRQATGERHGSRTHPEGIRRGEENGGGGKLTTQDVINIRAAYAKGGITQVELASRYGITQGMTSAITRGATWRHLLEVDEHANN
jgi:hypothetical protein